MSPSFCRWVKQENEISKSGQVGDSGPKLDLGFKEGQTITLNIGVKTVLEIIILTAQFILYGQSNM